MKMSRLISMVILGVALVATPVYAQRGGGGRSGGGSSSHSSGGSRGGGYSGSSYSGGSRSSSSSYSSGRSGSSYSSGRSGSSYSSGRSGSSNYSSSRSSSSPSYSSSSSSRSSDYSSSRSSNNYSSGRSGNSSNSSTRSDFRSGSRSGDVSRSNAVSHSRTGSVPSEIRSRSGQKAGRGDATRGAMSGDRSGGLGTVGRPSGLAPAPEGGYARPGHPGGPVPPSHRPMHPAPYFYHPHHHCMVHCHQLYWDPCCYHHWHWPGFWIYCNSYWYDYHVTDMVLVRQYTRENYKMDLIAYAINGDYMYALVNEADGHTYIQIYDQNDKLLAEQQVSRKYCKMEVDAQNGGCWIMKKKDRDPLLFLYADGQLLIYEADK